jgi:uncharacterized protein YdaU (DUF1376 family)
MDGGAKCKALNLTLGRGQYFFARYPERAGGFIMSKIPMQQWFPDTHIAHTANLTLEEQGAYRLIMDNLWIKGGSMRDNDKEVARMLRISVTRWQKIKVKLGDYLTIESNVITQKRLQEDYKDACEKSKKNTENGKAGGLKTAEKWKTAKANALASTDDTATSAPRLPGQARQLGDVIDQLELEPKT